MILARGGGRADLLRFLRGLLVHLLAPLAVAAAVGIPAGLWAAAGSGAFTSPDETGNYLTARTLAENGHFWLQLSGTGEDPEGLLHARQFVTIDGRATPTQFPLNPILHAAGFALTGGGSVSAGVVAALGAIGLFLALRRVAGGSDLSALVALVAATPVLFWLMRQYGGASSFVAVEGWALWASARWVQRPDPRWGALAGVLHGAALLARPDFLPFMAFAALVGFLALKPAFLTRRQWFAHFALMSGAGLMVFVPCLALYNTVLYGGPLENGPAVLSSSFEFQVPQQFSSADPMGIVSGVVFPAGMPDLQILPQNLWKYFIATAPFLTALGGAGLATFCRRGGTVRWAVVGGLLILISYGLISRLNENLNLAEGWTPTLSGSVSRYWLPVFLVVALLAAAGARSLFNSPQLVVVGSCAAFLAFYSIGFQYENASIHPSMSRMNSGQRLGLSVKDEAGSGLVYTSQSDKYIAPFVDTATLLPAGGISVQVPMLVSSMRRQLDAGADVFLYRPQAGLITQLLAEGLSLDQGQNPGLFRVLVCREGVACTGP